MDIKIADIQIGPRHRNDFGDLKALAASIREVGLINPITITPDKRLIAGERRIRAVRDYLGRPVIAVRVLDIESLVRGEHDENELRKDFTPSERVAIGRELEAAMGERRGGDTSAGQQRNPVNLPDCKGTETRELAAKQAGFGSEKTYRDAKKVVTDGVPDLVEAMDAGEVSISAAAKVAALPAEEQREILSPAAQEGVRVLADVVRGKLKEVELIPEKKRAQKAQAPERHPKLDAAIFFVSHCQDIVEFVESKTAALIAEGLDEFPETLEDDLALIRKAQEAIEKVKELYDAKHPKGEQGAGGRGPGKRTGPKRGKDNGQDNKGSSSDRNGEPARKRVRRGVEGGDICDDKGDR